MKNLVLTVIAAITLTLAAQAQTFIGKKSNNLHFAQIAANEFIFYELSNDSLIIYNDDLSLNQTIKISLNGNEEIQLISYISRNLFDQDNDLEFLITYVDSNSIYPTDVYVYDGGVYSTLPNYVPPQMRQNYISVHNTDQGAILSVLNFDGPETFVYSLPGNALFVKEHKLEDQQLYPNPSAEIVNVPAMPGEVVSVYSIDGKLLKQEQVKSRNHVLRVEDLTNGTYLIRSSNGGNWKLVKD